MVTRLASLRRRRPLPRRRFFLDLSWEWPRGAAGRSMVSRTRGREMSMKGMKFLSVVALLAAVAVSMPVFAKSAQDKRDEKMGEIPVCSKKIGTVAVVEPDTNWWQQAGLGSPEALIKVFVRKSNCFTLVDRGKGMQAIQGERALAAGGDLRGGSNVGQGQIKAADYILVPDLISSNNKAGGHRVGGLIGGLVGGGRAGPGL